MLFMKRFIWPIVVVLLLALVVWIVVTPGRTKISKYDGFAQCLKDSETIFYGAFWCTHCQAQKKIFGSAFQYLSYIECSTPDGKGQLQICKDAEITGYPTWVFKSGVRRSGELTFEELSKESDCPLPTDQP